MQKPRPSKPTQSEPAVYQGLWVFLMGQAVKPEEHGSETGAQASVMSIICSACQKPGSAGPSLETAVLGQDREPGTGILMKHLPSDSYQTSLENSAAKISSNSKNAIISPS